jgi:hypothetical protein
MGYFQVCRRNEGLCKALNNARSSPHILTIYNTRGLQANVEEAALLAAITFFSNNLLPMLYSFLYI